MRRVARPISMLLAAALGLSIALAGCGGASRSGNVPTHQSSSPRTAAGETTRSRLAAAAAPVLIPPADPQPRSVHVPVLTYHRVAALSAVGQLDLKVDPATFAAELAALHGAGYHTIHQWQLFDALYHGAPLPPRPIIISVDDGYIDDVRTILPDLERWHMVATFFVITGRMSEPGFLDAQEIQELDRAGMDVGDHTAHHVDLRLLDPRELAAETAGSRHVLDTVLGHAVYFFAYPFGAYNAEVVQAIKSAGFTMAYTTDAGATESTADPLTMPRIHVGRAETPAGLLGLLGGQ